MFVYELDRPWLDTPFLFQGFLIESPDQIEDLRTYCRFVYVDPARSTVSLGMPPEEAAPPNRPPGAARGKGPEPDTERSIMELDGPGSGATPTARLLAKLRIDYPDLASVEEELPPAIRTHDQAAAVAHAMFAGVAVKGTVDGKQLKQSIEQMTESVVRNPDALLLLSYLKKKSLYIYDHAVSVSIHLLAFGRHMGLPKPQLHALGMAGMLLDVGMARLPQAILGKQGRLSPEEYEQIKQHVQFCLEIVRNSSGITPQTAEIVGQHHERENGSGYPMGLAGRQISLLGKMAAIVDCFVALISERPYAHPTPPFEALQMLYNWRRDYYHEDLVEQFIQCLGPYPVGSLVELNSGEVAVVLAHNRVRRLKPRVMVVLDPDREPYGAPIMLDLLTAPKAFDGRPYEIQRSLPEGECRVDVKDFYL